MPELDISAAKNAPAIWGLRPEQRIRRQLSSAKLSSDQQSKGVLLLRGDVVYDTGVLRGLKDRPNTLLTADNGVPLAAHLAADTDSGVRAWLNSNGTPPHGYTTCSAAEVASSYNQQLRKRAAASCYVVDHENAAKVERALYDASYKGVTDLVTKYLWPEPAYHATRLCARLGLSPNMVTSIGAVLTLMAMWFFWHGQYGAGLLAGWLMTFLDTVDGKLARVTLTSSAWGNIFDHGIDLIHPPFWYLAWGIGLVAYATPLPEGWLAPTLWSMLGFYVLGRLVEGYFMRRFGMHLHVWRRFDSRFRLILARRNPNLILLTLSWLIGRPELGLLSVVGWHGITLLAHLVQVTQAERSRWRGEPVSSWLQS